MDILSIVFYYIEYQNFMSQISDIEQKGLVEALGIKQDDLFEVRFNLLGFFGALWKIDQRLKKEKNLKKLNNLSKDSLK